MPAPRFTRVFSVPAAEDPRPDAELLTRFLADRDEPAFTALVVRHAPGVRAVCRGWLRSPADVDDATQATFLVLVRRAESIRDRSAVGRWLLKTADLVARRLKKEQTRIGPLTVDVEAKAQPTRGDCSVVAAEVARLPAPYRVAIQLHYDAGLSASAAADRLGCPRATVLTRLARGRRILHRRLLARGVTPALVAVPGIAGTPAWVHAVVRAAVGSPAGPGLSPRSVSLSEGVVRAMTWKKLQLLAAAAMVATGLVGFVLGQWAFADGPQKKGTDQVATGPSAIGAAIGKAARPDDAEPPAAGGRREAVIRMPVGTFVKEVDIPPYGSGRITFTYETDRVHSKYELAVMGGELEFTTEAEVSMASTGTIYGVLTAFKVTHIKLPAEMKAEMLGGIDLAKAWPLVEPLVNDVVTDLPFSYSVRQSGDSLTIQHFRILLAGPNPLGKVGGLSVGGNAGPWAALAYFQAIGTALEGTYASGDVEKEAPKKFRPGLPKTVVPIPQRKGNGGSAGSVAN
jgi:RNA polymerase sigma factor (sigma-70 family)